MDEQTLAEYERQAWEAMLKHYEEEEAIILLGVKIGAFDGRRKEAKALVGLLHLCHFLCNHTVEDSSDELDAVLSKLAEL